MIIESVNKKPRRDFVSKMKRIVTLIAELGPLTSKEVAVKLGLNHDGIRKRYFSLSRFFTYRRDGLAGGVYSITTEAREEYYEPN